MHPSYIGSYIGRACPGRMARGSGAGARRTVVHRQPTQLNFRPLMSPRSPGNNAGNVTTGGVNPLSARNKLPTASPQHLIIVPCSPTRAEEKTNAQNDLS